MSTFASILGSAFDWTWQTSLQTSVLIILVLLLQRLLGRWLTPRLRYALSLLVFCRLLLPVAPSSPLSFENLLPQTPHPAQSSPPPALAAGSVVKPATSAHAHGLTLRSSLFTTWFCGLLFLGGLAVWRYHQWKTRIRSARQVSEARLLRILDEVRREVGIRRPIRLASLGGLDSAAVFGLWNLHLLLPESSLKYLSEREWRLVFLHEMTHIRNYDTVLNTMLIAVQFLHWFNPLVWIGLHRLRADRELVCDALVVERLEASERLSYAQVLLKLAEALSNGPRVFPSALPVVSSASEIKTRVTMIKYYRESSRALRAGVVSCILLLGFLSFTRAREGGMQTEKEGTASGSSGATGQEVENLTMREFKAAGYSLPESVLDDLIQETVKKEYGDRATLTRSLKDRGMTFAEFREQIRERFITGRLREGETNGTVLKYGPTTIRADRITYYPEQGRIVAEGHVAVQQRGQQGQQEGLASNGVTSREHSEQIVNAIGIRHVGPMSIPETEVLRRIRAQVGMPLDKVDIDGDVRNLYATGLFYNVRVSTELSSKGVDLVYTVQCNPRIAEIGFSGNSKFSDAQLEKLILCKVGDMFNERKAFSDSQAIQKAYEHASYQGSKVKYSVNIDQQTGKASVVFEIQEKN